MTLEERLVSSYAKSLTVLLTLLVACIATILGSSYLVMVGARLRTQERLLGVCGIPYVEEGVPSPSHQNSRFPEDSVSVPPTR
jgi:hypothetical protein